MASMTSNPLPWSVEAFRPYMTYEVLQEAVSVLREFEGSPTNLGRLRSRQLLKSLQRRTGLPWIADRKVQHGILINIEGSVFRRMKRIFTSFYLIDVESFDMRNVIKLTEFGKKLSSGVLTKEHFYSQLLERYSYPHAAYEENVRAWTGFPPFHPMRYVTEVHIEIEKLRILNFQGIQVKEFAALIHPVAHKITSIQAAKILENHYVSKAALSHNRTDAVDRKVADIIGFLVVIEVLTRAGNYSRFNPHSKVYEELKKRTFGKVKNNA